MVLTNCATTGLEAYEPSENAPWGRPRVQHLFRRLGYGASPEELELALMEGPAATVDRLLDEARDRPPREAPEWADWDWETFGQNEKDPFEAFTDWSMDWMLSALDHGVREKMELFWQNHFVTKWEGYNCPSYYYQYTETIRGNAFGNLKQFVVEITRSPAMLFFLNGFQNNRLEPNENYARELFELFTLGENNGYTQQDIAEASRALTGWNGWTTFCGEIEWAPWGHDAGEKTVFGRTGRWDYLGLIDILFEERGELIARYISEKIYRHFVNPNVSEEVVSGMAATMLAADFEIMPVLKQLFKSEHFFDVTHQGGIIKSPMDLLATWIREGQFGRFNELTTWGLYGMASMGMLLGEAPDVAGWPGNRAWIDSNRITLRWEFMDGFAWALYNVNQNVYRDFARELTNDSRSAAEIARAMIDYFIPGGLNTEEAYEIATDVYKWEVPANYYEDGTWSLNFPSAPWQGVILMRHIGRLPEFQLS